MSATSAMPSDIKCSAIIFDMDGTLVDTTMSVVKAWTWWGINHNVDPEVILASSHGRRTVDVIHEIAPELATSEEVYCVESYIQEHPEGSKALPNAKELLNGIPAGKWAIATSGSRYHAEGLLKFCGLTNPDNLKRGLLVTSDQVSHGKPHPESYITAAERMGVDPSHCVVFEDAPAGIRAGVASGATTIAVLTSHTFDEIKGCGQYATIPNLSHVKVTASGDGLIVTLFEALRN